MWPLSSVVMSKQVGCSFRGPDTLSLVIMVLFSCIHLPVDLDGWIGFWKGFYKAKSLPRVAGSRQGSSSFHSRNSAFIAFDEGASFYRVSVVKDLMENVMFLPIPMSPASSNLLSTDKREDEFRNHIGAAEDGCSGVGVSELHVCANSCNLGVGVKTATKA